MEKELQIYCLGFAVKNCVSFICDLGGETGVFELFLGLTSI